MKIYYENTYNMTPNYILQSNYTDDCTFWYYSDYEEVMDCKDEYDIGVWRIKYKSVK